MKTFTRDHDKPKAQTLSATSVKSSSSPLQNQSPQTNPQSENALEIRIIETAGDHQEIEITCGKRKKRIRIAKFLPKSLTNDPLASNIGATSNNSLKNQTQQPTSILSEKLLNALAKINFLAKENKIDKQIDYQKVWDGPERIKIDEKFATLSPQEKQQSFDTETQKRSNYLSTNDKAILVAAINYFREPQNKVERGVISSKFSEIADQNSFKNFINEVVNLIENHSAILDKFFTQQSQNSSLLKKENLSKNIGDILSEKSSDHRKDKIKNFVKFAGHVSSQTTSQN